MLLKIKEYPFADFNLAQGFSWASSELRWWSHSPFLLYEKSQLFSLTRFLSEILDASLQHKYVVIQLRSLFSRAEWWIELNLFVIIIY